MKKDVTFAWLGAQVPGLARASATGREDDFTVQA